MHWSNSVQINKSQKYKKKSFVRNYDFSFWSLKGKKRNISQESYMRFEYGKYENQTNKNKNLVKF